MILARRALQREARIAANSSGNTSQATSRPTQHHGALPDHDCLVRLEHIAEEGGSASRQSNPPPPPVLPHELQDSPSRSQPDHIAARTEARIAAQGYPLVRLRHDPQADHSAGPRQADFGAALLNGDVDDNNTSVELNRPATVPDNLHDAGAFLTVVMMRGGGRDGGGGESGQLGGGVGGDSGGESGGNGGGAVHPTTQTADVPGRFSDTAAALLHDVLCDLPRFIRGIQDSNGNPRIVFLEDIQVNEDSNGSTRVEIRYAAVTRTRTRAHAAGAAAAAAAAATEAAAAAAAAAAEAEAAARVAKAKAAEAAAAAAVASAAAAAA